jgi:hydrogenase maturation protease
MPDLREQLFHCFKGRICVMGIGNTDSGDDGVGVVLAEAVAAHLKRSGRISPAHNVIIAGAAPECMLGSTAGRGYDHLILLDAVEFGGEPGSVIFLNADEIVARFPQISTHKISIGLLARITSGEGTAVWLLGIQPGSLKAMQGLTPAVQRTLDILEELLYDLWTDASITAPDFHVTRQGSNCLNEG